jgi:adenine-specific DNA-methyltransferase
VSPGPDRAGRWAATLPQGSGGRPGDVPGLSVRSGEDRLLLLIPPGKIPDGSAIKGYLRKGRHAQVNKRYKCRVRRHWYSVPLPKKRPAAFIPYMTGDTPRLIVNESAAWSTNLLHGVTFNSNAPHPRAVSAAMLSSVTLLSAEVEGRSYGGGVLKLETWESERLLVPTLSSAAAATLLRLYPKLDALVRGGQRERATRLVDGVLDIDFEPLDRARRIIRSRRLGRGASSRK